MPHHSEPELSTNQAMILTLLAEGEPATTVAAHLGMDVATLAHTLSDLRRALAVRSTAQLVIRAQQLHLITPPTP
jgi:DNA-binding NarL/FixJ family response regulator